MAGKKAYEAVNPKKVGKKGYVHSGAIDFTNIRIRRVPSFVDFIRGGIEINLIVAIDFTGSNGDPREPQSLHYINPTYPNEYIRAIRSVGQVLAPYDSDKQFPVHIRYLVIAKKTHAREFSGLWLWRPARRRWPCSP